MGQNLNSWGKNCNCQTQKTILNTRLQLHVQRVDNAIRSINFNPADDAIVFPNTYPLDGDLSGR